MGLSLTADGGSKRSLRIVSKAAAALGLFAAGYAVRGRRSRPHPGTAADPPPARTETEDARRIDELVDALAVAERRGAAATAEIERRAAELERSNEELEQFAYVASHDLSEPLRMVTGYLQLLERRYADGLDDDAREFIHFAVDGATRMRTLIDDLLVYSRAGRAERVPEPVAVRATVDATLRSLAAAIDEAGAEIHVDDDLPTVSVDPVSLGQVFQNLVSNAVKFHQPRHALTGDGTPPVPVVHIGAERDDEDRAWHFVVTDNGIGIEPRHHERIFKMFQRLHPRHDYAGTGIGLAVVRKIIDRHGGRIWVESAPGRGTSIHFTLPDPPVPAVDDTWGARSL